MVEALRDTMSRAVQDPRWMGDPTPSILLIADPASDADGRAAVTASGARLLGQVAWTGAVERLHQQGLVRVVLAETHGAADDLLETVLSLLGVLASRGDIRLIVALAPSQIDLVVASLGVAPVDLLCAPSVFERVGCLCVALSPSLARLQDVGGTSEAARLVRLNQEIARIAETLTRLTRDDPADVRAGVSEPGLAYRAGASSGRSEIRVREVRDAIRARRLRDQVFGTGLFEDPAWDMLLDLFAAELERAQVSVSSLCIAAGVAPTTALRWITRMTDAGLFERRPDPFDRRRAFIALSSRASAGMRSYVDTVRQAGAAIA